MKSKIVDVRDLSICIKDEIIVKDINLPVYKGDFIFLKGSNGSGKSTFLNVLSRDDPDKLYTVSGKIIYEDKSDILSLDDVQWYKKSLYYIPQISDDTGDTVYGKLLSVMETIDCSLTFSGAASFLEKYGITLFFSGLDPKKLLHRKIASLSEGQKKIIEIFCALIRAPYIKMLIIDEPLNHMDSNNIKEVIRLFQDLRSNYPELAILITTHCQAFPAPTRYLILHDKTIQNSPEKYTQYRCFDLFV